MRIAKHINCYGNLRTGNFWLRIWHFGWNIRAPWNHTSGKPSLKLFGWQVFKLKVML